MDEAALCLSENRLLELVVDGTAVAQALVVTRQLDGSIVRDVSVVKLNTVGRVIVAPQLIM
jgi:hypothetical protein